MSALLDAALRYAARGWPVFPLAPGSKKPRKDSKGVHEATTDEAQIRAWWAEADYNIGLATGSPSGVVVVDIDDLGAYDVLDPPATAMVLTAKGIHLYYRYSEPLPNSASKLAPRVDTRGDGGYVVLPPSTVGDSTYARADGSPSEMAPLPQWIVDRLTERSNERAEPEGEAFASPWGKAVLDGEIARVVQSENGSRNDTLFRAAANVYGAVKTGHIDVESATRLLFRASTSVGLEPDEINATLESALRKAEPREPAPREDRPAAGPAPAPAVSMPPKPKRGGLMTLDDLDSLPPLRWLIPGVLPEGLTILYGPPGGGKSFNALDWSLTLASTGKAVVYCAGEGASGLRARVRSWMTAHNASVAGNFFVLTFGSFPRLLDPTSVHELRASLDDLPKEPALIVIDTWARAMVGEADYDTRAISHAVGVLDGLRSDYGASSLVVHHPKGGERGDPRGPALVGAADCMWRCDEYDGERYLANTKAKDWEELPRMKFRLRPVGESAVVEPSVIEQAG